MTPDRLDDTQLQQRLTELNADTAVPWTRSDNRLSKTFVFADFAEAFGFMTRVAIQAERADHHPDWCNSYKRVEINLSTHSAGGLTDLDFDLATAIEAAATR
jgi:4a-hydroxytetrahydrobiopterin dehydratase